MGVVAPVSGVLAVVLPVVVGVVTGERPGAAGLARHRRRGPGHLAGRPRARHRGCRPHRPARVRATACWPGSGSAASSPAWARSPTTPGSGRSCSTRWSACWWSRSPRPCSAPRGSPRTRPAWGGALAGLLGGVATTGVPAGHPPRAAQRLGRAHLALPGVHGAARRAGPPRARAPRPGVGSRARAARRSSWSRWARPAGRSTRWPRTAIRPARFATCAPPWHLPCLGG